MAVSNPSLSLFLAVLLVGLSSDGYGVSGLNILTYAASSLGTRIQELNDLAHGYKDNVELEDAINEFNDKCVNISRIYSIGKSVKGVPLLVMEISNNPGKEEAKPAFKFIGNVHGDEPVGRELLLKLANWLCDNYMTDDLAKLIVDNVHLHILPSMNPDGFSLRTRDNANNIDLNRDFPDQFNSANDDLKKRQPETRAIMEWSKKIHFTASASIHGGNLVAIYPWDGTADRIKRYHACPDDEVSKYMANLYSGSHFNMSLSNKFEQGITNGAQYAASYCNNKYPIYGGMQDWNYIFADCFELTLEISDNKWPPANELQMIWQDNKRSMLDLVASLAKLGVHGRIFTSDCGEPLPASISVNGINKTSEVPGRITSDSREPLPASILVSGTDKTLHQSTMAVSNSSLLPFLVVLSLVGFLVVSARDGYGVSGLNISTYAASILGIYIPELDLGDGYMTNSDLRKAIKAFHGRYRGISRIYSIGKSVRGVPLWVMEISNNPGKEEAKPAFKFIGNMHGDEPVGRELLLKLANWLCDNYMRHDLATFIVDNVHLHILPSMNPDGFKQGTRKNANDKDLNRDFPDQFIPRNNDLKKRQPETKAIMRWSKEIRFTASASIHGGKLVASYPWDGTPFEEDWYHACPDDELFKYMARLYSRSNPSMCTERYGGIINGAQCEHIYGGMQDWNYIHADCFELTLELSVEKRPPADRLEEIWKDNKWSMLALVASIAKCGVHGRIFSSDCGEPLPASISVKGINYTSEVSGRISSSDSEEPLPEPELVTGEDNRSEVPGRISSSDSEEPLPASISINGITYTSEVPGRISSSDSEEPLPASISINGITYTSEVPGRISSSDSEEPLPEPELVTGEDKTIQASKTFGHYHRLLVPRLEYEVTATRPGYRSQNKIIRTSTQGPVTLRFDLDPDTSQDNGILEYFYQKLDSLYSIFVGILSKLRNWTITHKFLCILYLYICTFFLLYELTTNI